jgi:hypothetical protein
MAFQLLNFQVLPTAVIANPTDRAEIVAYRALASEWATTVLNQLTVYNPNHDYAVPFPNDPPADADQAARIARLHEITQYVNGLFSVYGAGYAALAQAMVASNQPAPVPAVPPSQPPKIPLPEKFIGKSSTAARQFLRQCKNYAAICPFDSPTQEIRWILHLMQGDARPWRDEQLTQYALVPPPAHLTDRALFEIEFKVRWIDPHEGEKALDRILEGQITQRTSVKLYNDQFNGALALTTKTGADPDILRSYETGLKPAVRIAAIVALIAQPNISFHDRQKLMIRLDEGLMDIRASNTSTPRQALLLTTWFIAPGAPRLTNEERENLRRIGGCFRCRQVGPRNIQAANVATFNPPPATPSDF